MGIFGDVTDTLFGKDPNLDLKTRSTLSSGQQKALEKVLLPFLTEQPLDQVEGIPFTGERVAGLSEVEQALIGQTGNVIEGISGDMAGIRGALDPLLAGGVGDFEDFFQRTVAEPGLEQFEEDILPALRRQFGPSGFFGTERERATTEATEDLNDALTRERSRIGFETRESALDRIVQAAQVAGGLPGQAAGALSQLQPIAQTERAVEQERLDKEFEEFLRVRVQERDKRIQQLLQALNVQAVENVGAGLPGTEGLVQSFLGGGGAGGLLKLFNSGGGGTP